MDVDVIVFVVEAREWNDEDENVLKRLKDESIPVILVINKIDTLRSRDDLLPLLQKLSQKMSFTEVVPVAAIKGESVEHLEKTLFSYLPQQEMIYPEDYITDRSERFLAAEIVREKLMRSMGRELPYAVTVEIEQFKREKGVLKINALIWVERKSQKAIVIGKGGAKLKEIGQQARVDMEKLFDSKIYLECWVKVKEGWSDNERILSSLGYRDEE
jgi:GTP-binding protein Era